ncbi:T9SS type A sorting domain-containing protein [Hymenobacter swuensis]|uniref:Secretion system C-terminal sorting domain-containing protein n=1 Tax=Hymenobacter swuensis DY53 TaxID=1227739 RepID=W8EU33_9BACT|nr:T9SS type A sorting domain-containing protein [Hymenobacter swuensis]AHJ95292.1 hypothetical protein Hsw_PB0002 [Hymenobacter swuensis DY53]
MKHSLFFKAISALALTSSLVLGQHTAYAQEDEPWAKKLLQQRRSASKPSVPPLVVTRPTTIMKGPCELIPNGDFESQTTGSTGPTQLNNLGGGVPGWPGDQAPIAASELQSWSSNSQATPEYYANNGTIANIRPATGAYASFSPFSGVGAVGLFSRRGGNTGFDDVSEYINAAIPTLTAGSRYYAQFQAQLSSNTLAANSAVSNGFGLLFSNGQPTANNGFRDFITINGPTVLSGPIARTNTSLNDWRLVSGQFTASGTENRVTIGMFNPTGYAQPVGTNLVNTYILVDDVELYKIPTAGPDRACSSTGVQLGEGCAIPGATYAWRQSGNATVQATTLQWNVQPATTTTYTLTVRLPDGSTHTTSVKVNVCPPCPALTDAPTFYLVQQTPNTSNSNATFNIKVLNTPGVEFFTLNLQNGNPADNRIMSVNDDGFGFSTFVLGLIGETWYHTTVVASNSCGNVSPTAYKYLHVPGCPPGGCSGGEDPYFTSTTPAYPNPAAATLNVEVTTPSTTGFIYLLDGRGNVARKVRANQKTTTLDVQDLPAGLYQLVTPAEAGKKPVRTTIQVVH